MLKILIRTFEDKTIDITNAVQSGLKWSGKRKGAPRKVTFKTTQILSFELKNGYAITVYEDDESTFSGYIFNNEPGKVLEYQVTAFDQIYYMIRNKEIYLLKNKTATELLQIIGEDFELNLQDNIIDTKFVIGTIIKENKKLYDIVQEGLDDTYANTGEQFFIRDSPMGELGLIDSFQEITIPESYITDITIKRSIEKTATRVRTIVRNNDVRTSVVANNEEAQQQWGVLQDYLVLDKDINFAQQVEQTQVELNNRSIEGETIRLKGIHIKEAISGNVVNIEGVGKFFIDEDVHTYNGDEGATMDLKLTRR